MKAEEKKETLSWWTFWAATILICATVIGAFNGPGYWRYSIKKAELANQMKIEIERSERNRRFWLFMGDLLDANQKLGQEPNH